MFQQSTAYEIGGVKNMLLEVVDQIDNSLEESQENCENENYPEPEFAEEFLDQPESQSHVDNESDLIDDESEDVKSVQDELSILPGTEDEMEVIDDFECDETHEDETIQTTPTEVLKRRSNRQANPETWLRNKRKLAKNTGQSYYASNGKYVGAKEMKCHCGQSCRMQCIIKISEEKRHRNFKYFYSLGDIAKQRKFLFEHMKTYEPRRTKIPKNPQKLRAVQRCYFLDLNHDDGTTELVQVCKRMFLNTFAISSQMIDTLHRKAVNEGRFNDVRGKFERKR